MSGMTQDNVNQTNPHTGNDDSGGSKGTMERLKDLFWEPAIILALVSAFAYICAYVYEIGYCNYFGIPRDLIVINWVRFFINLPVVAMLPVAIAVVPVAIALLGRKINGCRYKIPRRAEKVRDNCLIVFLECLLGKLKDIAKPVKQAKDSFLSCLKAKYSRESKNRCMKSLKSALTCLWRKSGCIAGWMKKAKDQYLKYTAPWRTRETRNALSLDLLASGLTFVILMAIGVSIKAELLAGAVAFIFLLGLFTWCQKITRRNTLLVILPFMAFWITFLLTWVILWFYQKDLINSDWQQTLLAIPVILGVIAALMTYYLFPLLYRSMKVYRKWKSYIIAILLVILLGFFLSYYSDTGKNEAKDGQEYLVQSSNQSLVVPGKEYPVLSLNQSLVVLRIYGDNAICVLAENESGSYIITKAFIILPVEDMTLTSQKIGPLHVKEAE